MSHPAKPQIFVTRQIAPEAIEKLQQHCIVDLWKEETPPPYETLIERTKGKDGLLCMLTDRIDQNFLEKAGGSLKVVSQLAAGYDNIDVTALAHMGIPLGNTPGILTEATADIAFLLILATARRLNESIDYVKNGEWTTWHPLTLLGVDLAGATLGIYGYGRIGAAVAKRAAGFGMNILAHSRSLTVGETLPDTSTTVSFETLFQESDFLSLHAPLTAETHHIIRAETLQMMKPNAILINTGRGKLVDHDALYNALVTKQIRAAGLDVTDPEPFPADHPLLSLPHVIVLPHIGSATIQTRTKMAFMAVENLLAGLNGTALPHPVKGS